VKNEQQLVTHHSSLITRGGYMFSTELLKDISTDLSSVEAELSRYAVDSATLLGETSSHLVAAGGKRLRPAFVLLSGKLFGGSSDQLIPLAVASELFHMATLVHDDVIDEADLRRNLPTVRAEWGDAVALCTGDYLFAQALILIARHGNEQISRILAEVSMGMCQGEIGQIDTAGRIDQSVRTYLRRIKRKTAMLISACCLIGAMAGGADGASARHMKQYGYFLGMAFQITDDILDFEGSKDVFGKPVGNDLRQGIFTLPAIYALNDQRLGPQLAQLIFKQDKEEADWEAGLELIRQSGALDQSRMICNRYLRKARQQLSPLPDLKERRILNALADFVEKRKF
jgi:heptaprenyl diphosphate synthase